MHRACHTSALVRLLRNALPGATTESQIRESRDALIEAHIQWRERPIVRKADEGERLAEVLQLQTLHLDTPNSLEFNPYDSASSQSFLTHPRVHISDFFFASRLDNWRAIQLYIGLIDQPMWGIHDSALLVCAVDLCRTHAALGVERNFLGAEKACGLYLAGVTFGGPEMYSVHAPLVKLADMSQKESRWVLDRLQEMSLYYPIASSFIKNLKCIWKFKGNYWDSIKLVSDME